MRLCSIAVDGGVVCEYRTEEGYVNINCRLTSSVEVLLNGVCVPLVGLCAQSGRCGVSVLVVNPMLPPSCFASSLDLSVFVLKLLSLYNVPSQVSS
jgi:hypothetical protein